mgnify:CR=1 FL=1
MLFAHTYCAELVQFPGSEGKGTERYFPATVHKAKDGEDNRWRFHFAFEIPPRVVRKLHSALGEDWASLDADSHFCVFFRTPEEGSDKKWVSWKICFM